jgi:hypothetical protein
MADTNIKISLELADKAAQAALGKFIDKSAGADRALGKLKSTGQSTFNEISIGIGKSIGVYDIFAGNLAAGLALKGFEALTDAARVLFQTFIVDGIAAAEAQEVAINDLNTSLAQTGIYSAETSKDLQDFATELQRTTTYEDDLILKNAALIQSLAALDKDGLKRTTNAAIELSAALGKDLSTTSEVLAKAANGNVTALQKMGIQFEEGRTKAETFENILSSIESRFSGSAIAKVNTYAGAIAQSKNVFGELTEEVGNLIVKNPVAIASIKAVSDIIKELTDNTNGQQNAFMTLVGEGIVLLSNSLGFLVAVGDATVRTFQFLYGVTQAITKPFLALVTLVRSVSIGFEQAANEFEAFTSDMRKNLDAFGDTGDGVLAKTSEGLLRVGAAAESSLGSIGTSSTGAIEPLNRVGGAVKQVSEETKAANESLKQFAIQLYKQSLDSEKASEATIENAKAKAEAEQLALKEQLDSKLISYYDYQLQRDAIDAEFDAVRIETEAARFEEENAKLQEARDKKLINDKELFISREQLAANFANTQAKRNLEAQKRDSQNKKELLQNEKAYGEAKLQATSQIFGALASIAALGGAKMFKIVKAFNLAEAITAGILSVQKAAASAPPPFNAPAITAATITSVANVARIAATKAPSFQDGGIVPGSSFSGDRVSANVNSGEMILNRGQQRQLFNIANGSGGGDGELKELLRVNNTLLGGILSAVKGGQSISINGREVFQVMRDELAGGRRFT